MDCAHVGGYHAQGLLDLLGAPWSTWCLRAWPALVAVLALGCGNDGLTELVVAVDSDLAVPGELQSVHLRVEGPTGDIAVDQGVDLTAGGAPRMPLTLSLTPGSDALAPVVIVATGMGPGGTVQRRVETGFVRGERRVVPMPLLRACVGVTCPVGETCTAAGACVDSAIDPGSLPPWTGEPEHFDAGPESDAGMATDAAMDAATVTDAATATDAGTDAAAWATRTARWTSWARARARVATWGPGTAPEAAR
jgi:hypothetical protein